MSTLGSTFCMFYYLYVRSIKLYSILFCLSILFLLPYIENGLLLCQPLSKFTLYICHHTHAYNESDILHPSRGKWATGRRSFLKINIETIPAFLTLYLRSKLDYTDDGATEIYHLFSTLVYLFPIFGGILADNYLGKYR